MKMKSIITAILLLFVAASIVYAVIQETRNTPPAPTEEQAVPDLTVAEVSKAGEEAAETENKAEVKKIVVYYFHGNMRCTTCKNIEAYTKEAVEKNFSDALKNNLLEMQVVNVEELENSHFIKDFKLIGRSVVIEEFNNGKSIRWNNLKRVWNLISKKDEFLKYVESEIRGYLKTDKE